VSALGSKGASISLEASKAPLRFCGLLTGVRPHTLQPKEARPVPTHRVVLQIEGGRPVVLTYAARSGLFLHRQGKQMVYAKAGSLWREWVRP
jgi:hypothetical protein